MSDAAGRRPLIVAPLARELAPLVRALRDASRVVVRGVAVRAGEIDGRAVLIAATGDGATCARRGLDRIFASSDLGIDRVLVIGIAGGLDPDLAVGEVVHATTVVSADGTPAPAPDATGADGPSGRCGAIVTVPRILATREAKRAAFDAADRPEGAVADLETVPYAHACAATGIPYSAVRVVSDTATEDLPLDFERYRLRDGRVSSARVAAAAIVRPKKMAALAALRRRVDRAAEALARAAHDWLGR